MVSLTLNLPTGAKEQENKLQRLFAKLIRHLYSLTHHIDETSHMGGD